MTKVTTKELAKALCVPMETIRKRARKGGWKQVGPCVKRSGYVYDLDTLPLNLVARAAVNLYLTKSEHGIAEIKLDCDSIRQKAFDIIYNFYLMSRTQPEVVLREVEDILKASGGVDTPASPLDKEGE